MADVASGVASQVQEALSATFTAPFKQFSKLFDGDDTDDEERKQSIISRTRNFARRTSSTSQARPQSPHQPSSNDHRRSASSGSQIDPTAAAARQATQETRESKRIEKQEHKNVVETLQQMFLPWTWTSLKMSFPRNMDAWVWQLMPVWPSLRNEDITLLIAKGCISWHSQAEAFWLFSNVGAVVNGERQD
ncbi:hypothetical protein V1508DRAFT_426517 [Lipomyces doorenjongii]|uniref:uncharacterized protein n=1 Tax=Lipomyces doorenjongii TaxID=383834 RepID=UPI0034CF6CE7